MDAGSEMDKVIALMVMDEPEYWSVHFGGSHYGDFKTLAAAEACARKIQGDFKAYIEKQFYCPHYSTSIAAAWEVAEKLKHFTLRRRGDTWTVEYRDCGNPMDHVIVDECCASINAATAPLAICLAALKAVGYDTEQKEQQP